MKKKMVVKTEFVSKKNIIARFVGQQDIKLSFFAIMLASLTVSGTEAFAQVQLSRMLPAQPTLAAPQVETLSRVGLKNSSASISSSAVIQTSISQKPTDSRAGSAKISQKISLRPALNQAARSKIKSGKKSASDEPTNINLNIVLTPAATQTLAPTTASAAAIIPAQSALPLSAQATTPSANQISRPAIALATELPKKNETKQNGQQSSIVSTVSSSETQLKLATQRLNQATNLRMRELRATKPILGSNGLTIEALGRAGVYSVNYDRMVGSMVSLGVGFSYLSLASKNQTPTTNTAAGAAGGSAGALPADSTTVTKFANGADTAVDNDTLAIYEFPVYTNIYFAEQRHRPYFTAGGTIVHLRGTLNQGSRLEEWLTADSSVTYTGTFIVPQAGLGYEFRGYGGWLTRLTAYGMYANQKLTPWGGLSFGATF
jgi:hypothetical protein